MTNSRFDPVATEHGGRVVSGIGYERPVRVLMRSPTAALYMGGGLNIWSPRPSSAMSAIKSLTNGRTTLAIMESAAVRLAIVEVFGENADDAAISAFRARGKDALGTVLVDGGGDKLDFFPTMELGLTEVDGVMIWVEPKDHPMLTGKFGYQHASVRRRAAAWLRATGLDGEALYSATTNAMYLLNEAFPPPTYREISDRRNAEMVERQDREWEDGTGTRDGFTKPELERLVEHFEGANDPVAISIFEKARDLLIRS